MKRLFAVFLFVFSLSALTAQTKVPFAVGEWKPYTGKDIEGFGVAAEIVTAACRAGGLQAEYEFYPWLRAELYVKEGKSFATFPYAQIKEREADFLFSDTILVSSISILRNKNSRKTQDFKYSSLGDFKGFKIGTTVGSLRITAPLAREKIYYEETDTFDRSLIKLQAGRIDFIIDNRLVIIDGINRLYPERKNDFVFLADDFAPGIHYKLMVSRKYPGADRLLLKFNEGLKLIGQNGIRDKIYRKYGLL